MLLSLAVQAASFSFAFGEREDEVWGLLIKGLRHMATSLNHGAFRNYILLQPVPVQSNLLALKLEDETLNPFRDQGLGFRV